MTVHAWNLYGLRQWMLALVLLGISCLASKSRQPADPDEIQVAVDAHDARNSAAEAEAAAKHAQEVAAHSVHIAHGAHRALKQARDALRAVRASVATTTPAPVQVVPRVSTVGNNLSAMVVQRLPSANASDGNDNLEQMQDQLQQLREQLAECKGTPAAGGTEKSIDQMDQELQELQAMLQKLEAEEARSGKRGSHNTLHGEIEHLRGAISRLEKFGRVSASLPPKVRGQHQGELRYRIPAKMSRPRVQLTPLADLDARSYNVLNSAQAMPAKARVAEPLPPSQTAPSSGGFAPIDVDTEMPYGELEPFGREDTAQELTEASIRESDEMVDQLERAEVAEEKRAVFRALTRLRGAAITSFDGVANSQTGNIDEYNKVHQWRVTHPLNHLADEESDVTKWAFPDNADF
jgi:hypothetical protein